MQLTRDQTGAESKFAIIVAVSSIVLLCVFISPDQCQIQLQQCIFALLNFLQRKPVFFSKPYSRYLCLYMQLLAAILLRQFTFLIQAQEKWVTDFVSYFLLHFAGIIADPAQSLFTYGADGSWGTFYRPDYIPAFGVEFSDSELEEKAQASAEMMISACSIQLPLGMSTLELQQEKAERNKKPSQSCLQKVIKLLVSLSMYQAYLYALLQDYKVYSYDDV